MQLKMFCDFGPGKNVFGNPCRSHFYNGGYPWIGIHSCCLCLGSPSPSHDYVTIWECLMLLAEPKGSTSILWKLWGSENWSWSLLALHYAFDLVENDNKASLVQAGDHLAFGSQYLIISVIILQTLLTSYMRMFLLCYVYVVFCFHGLELLWKHKIKCFFFC